MQALRANILRVFAVALIVTILVSLYLAWTVTRPILLLAEAAERTRHSPGRSVTIPDFGGRRDEIGELSEAMRDMTQALWARLDAIERFAADVSHEIKNPLTSLKSAIETATMVKDPERQAKLFAVVLEDVHRIDRLITDIAEASRIDAEMSRSEAERIDLAAMLETIADYHRTRAGDDGPTITVTVADGDRCSVQGLEGRLGQVFDNLVTNAISFSPADGTVALTLAKRGDGAEITVTDDGPGIPPNKLDAIFDRFYTDRPTGDKVASHSGLGLSIARQVVAAHRGEIFAENRSGLDDTVTGARFTVRLPLG